jgi:hypothetical protein
MSVYREISQYSLFVGTDTSTQPVLEYRLVVSITVLCTDCSKGVRSKVVARAMTYAAINVLCAVGVLWFSRVKGRFAFCSSYLVIQSYGEVYVPSVVVVVTGMQASVMVTDHA